MSKQIPNSWYWQITKYKQNIKKPIYSSAFLQKMQNHEIYFKLILKPQIFSSWSHGIVLSSKCHKSLSSVSWQITHKIWYHVYISLRTGISSLVKKSLVKNIVCSKILILFHPTVHKVILYTHVMNNCLFDWHANIKHFLALLNIV